MHVSAENLQLRGRLTFNMHSDGMVDQVTGAVSSVIDVVSQSHLRIAFFAACSFVSPFAYHFVGLVAWSLGRLVGWSLQWVYSCDYAQYCAGQPIVESAEMRPEWFQYTEIPFESMWADDELWFPHLLDGGLFQGVVEFDDKSTIASHSIAKVEVVDTSNADPSILS